MFQTVVLGAQREPAEGHHLPGTTDLAQTPAQGAQGYVHRPRQAHLGHLRGAAHVQKREGNAPVESGLAVECGDVNALAALPPTPGAKLGKDPQGNPAWYIADPQRPGKYLKVEA